MPTKQNTEASTHTHTHTERERERERRERERRERATDLFRSLVSVFCAQLCAEAAGVADVEIINYNPEEVGVEGKKAFPFRYAYHFFAEPRAALTTLGMTYERTLGDALKERWAAYEASGRAQKDMSSKFEIDDKIIAAVKQTVNA